MKQSEPTPVVVSAKSIRKSSRHRVKSTKWKIALELHLWWFQLFLSEIRPKLRRKFNALGLRLSMFQSLRNATRPQMRPDSKSIEPAFEVISSYWPLAPSPQSLPKRLEFLSFDFPVSIPLRNLFRYLFRSKPWAIRNRSGRICIEKRSPPSTGARLREKASSHNSIST